MKKSIVILSAIFLISLCSFAFANSSVDLSVFPKNTFKVIIDEFTGNFTIGYITASGNFEHSNTGRYQSEISAMFSNTSGEPSFGVFINYTADSWIFADNVMVKIGDNVYTIKNASVQRKVIDGGDIRELFWLSGSNEYGRKMMDDWAAHTGNIRIRLSGETNFDFTVPAAAQIKIAEFYKLYLKSCGLSVDEPEQATGIEYYEAIGTGTGFVGNVEVKVTTDGNKITSVEVLSCDDTPGIRDAAIAVIPDAIVNANSTQVDCAAGATFTSKAIIQAVEEALLLIPHN